MKAVVSVDGKKRLADAVPSKTTLNARKSRKVWSCCSSVSESESALCLVPFVQCSFFAALLDVFCGSAARPYCDVKSKSHHSTPSVLPLSVSL